MLEIRKTAISFEEKEVMELEGIILDGNEKEALSFLKKSVYDRIAHSQQVNLSHISIRPVRWRDLYSITINYLKSYLIIRTLLFRQLLTKYCNRAKIVYACMQIYAYTLR